MRSGALPAVGEVNPPPAGFNIQPALKKSLSGAVSVDPTVARAMTESPAAARLRAAAEAAVPVVRTTSVDPTVGPATEVALTQATRKCFRGMFLRDGLCFQAAPEPLISPVVVAAAKRVISDGLVKFLDSCGIDDEVRAQATMRLRLFGQNGPIFRPILDLFLDRITSNV